MAWDEHGCYGMRTCGPAAHHLQDEAGGFAWCWLLVQLQNTEVIQAISSTWCMSVQTSSTPGVLMSMVTR